MCRLSGAIITGGALFTFLVAVYIGCYLVLRTHSGSDDNWGYYQILDMQFALARSDSAREHIKQAVMTDTRIGSIVGESYICEAIGLSGGAWTLIFLPALKIENACR